MRKVNDAPAAAANSYSAAEDQTLRVRAPGVLGNDREADGDRLEATVAASPEPGTLGLNRGGSLSYKPDDDFHGRDAFRYRVSGGRDGAATAEVSITVRPRPEPDECTIEGTAGTDVLRGTSGRG